MKTKTVDLDDQTLVALEALALEQARPVDEILSDAIASYVFARAASRSPDEQAAYLAAVDFGLAAADRGDVVAHEQVVAAFRTRYRQHLD